MSEKKCSRCLKEFKFPYLLKKHLGPFLFCFFGVMFVLLMQFLVLHIDKLIGKDIPLGVILELIITNLAYMVVLAAPMAVLVASLMAFGKFSEHNELTALRASGVNTLQIIYPLLGMTLTFGLMGEMQNMDHSQWEQEMFQPCL